MEDLTPRALVQAALRHEQTERLPYNFTFTPPARAELVRHYGAEDLIGRLDLAFDLFACHDKPLYASPKDHGPTIRDEFGVVWSTSDRDRGCPIGHPLGEATLRGYVFPDPRAPRRWEGMAELATSHPRQYRLAFVGDLWERAGFMRGLDQLLMDLYTAPRFVHDLLDRLCEYNLATLAGMARFRPDGVFISDDYGFQDRLMMAPDAWREFVKPCLARLVSAAKRHELVAFLHSCGNISAIVPDLIGIGLDILHPIQPEAMDIFALKRQYGRDLTFCGGISTQRVLPFGAPGEVRAEVETAARVMGEGGGYVLEPGITLQADIPLRNLVALIETARAYRRGEMGTTGFEPVTSCV